MLQLQERLGTEAVGLEGVEQLNSRDVDPAPAQQKADADADDHVLDNDVALVMPNSLNMGAEVIGDQEQHSGNVRHDPNEL